MKIPDNKKLSDELNKLRLGYTKKITPIKEGLETKNYIISTVKGKYILKKYKKGSEKEVIYESELLEYLESKHFRAPRVLSDVIYVEGYPCVIHKYIERRKLQPSDVNAGNIKKIATMQSHYISFSKSINPNTKESGILYTILIL